MTINRISAVCLAAAMTVTGQATYANDIIDFLRAVNGVSDYDHHHDEHPSVRHHRRHRVRHAAHDVDVRVARPYRRPRSRRSVSINIGTYPSRRPTCGVRPLGPYPIAPRPLPIVPQPLPIAPPPSAIGALPHSIGEIVTCPVHLEPHVQIRNAHEIAPNAVPVIIAVRDPHLPAWGSHGCVESLVYVQVYAPPGPPCRVKVSPCRTRITMEWGEYEVRIRSCHDVVKVEYDD